MFDFKGLQQLAREGQDEPCEISVADLEAGKLRQIPKNIILMVWESDFPETSLERVGKTVIAQIQEHIYTKYWEHKYHARVFADAMVRAVRRLRVEGHPVSDPEIEGDDDVHIFVRWNMVFPLTISGKEAVEAIRAAYNLVWSRANQILEDSDSVLVLGKDTGVGMARLKRIADKLADMGYFPYIIKEQPDRIGESILQKVLRHALISKFVIVENTDASGHLYEIPHVAKMAECVTAVVQESGKGATWMFEDCYAKVQSWKKFEYKPGRITDTVEQAAAWAEQFIAQFGQFQMKVLPWLSKTQKNSKPKARRKKKHFHP